MSFKSNLKAEKFSKILQVALISAIMIYLYSWQELQDFKINFTDEEKLALLVGCLCHDLDHRGTNNTFQVKYDKLLLLNKLTRKLNNK